MGTGKLMITHSFTLTLTLTHSLIPGGYNTSSFGCIVYSSLRAWGVIDGCGMGILVPAGLYMFLGYIVLYRYCLMPGGGNIN